MKRVCLAFGAAVVSVLAMGNASANITSYSATLETSWPSSGDTPFEGVASLALDNVSNELSWAVEWAGTEARRARVNLLGPLCAENSDCPSGAIPDLVLDLADGTSIADVRGGFLSGRMQLTPAQVDELVAAPDSWRVEVQLWNKRGVRLEGELELEALPPGVWL